MPRGDGTGPMGLGPMTGRGAGFCAGYSVPGYVNPYVYGRGLGLGRGRGRGYRWWYRMTGLPGWMRAGYPPAYGTAPAVPLDYGTGATKDEQLEFLKNQSEYLKETLEGIKSHIADLEKEVEKK